MPAHNLREFDGKRDLYLEFGPNWVWVAPVAVFHSARWLQPKQIQIFKHKCLNFAACFLFLAVCNEGNISGVLQEIFDKY